MNYIMLLCISLIAGGAGAWLIAQWGRKLNLLDIANARSSHRGAVPKGGGIGITVAFIISSVALPLPISFWIPAVFLSLISLWGDRFEIRPAVRLVFQFGAAAAFFLPMLLSHSNDTAMYALAPLVLIFIAGTANCYNFMDGINGIAAITGLVAFGLLAFYTAAAAFDDRYVVLSLCLSLSCLGFLPFNMPEAKVFMGDTGSILLGFVFAAMIILLSGSLLDFACYASLLFPFYVDECTTLIVRIKDGDSLTKPHRKHLYQILANEKGISHWKVSVAYGAFQIVVGTSAFAAKPFGYAVVFLVLTVFVAGFSLLTCAVRKHSGETMSAV